MSDTYLLPPWREAAKRFFEDNFKPGDVIPHSWFYEAMGFRQPTDDMPFGEANNIKVKFLKEFDRLRKALLHDHQVDLASEFAIGYRWVPPKEQTELATTDLKHDFKKIFTKAIDRLGNVNPTPLSHEERRQNADAVARFSQLAYMVRKRIASDL